MAVAQWLWPKAAYKIQSPIHKRLNYVSKAEYSAGASAFLQLFVGTDSAGLRRGE